MTAAEVRQTFLDFFKSKGHTIVPSAPIVVKNDPTLMFTNAGMNQFKDIFLGNEPAKYKRVTDTQKCLRVSGKHNDLEEVGVDTYHHTMFEMLGNWSFGDYFKKEAIEWAWELLTEVYKLDKNRLYVSVFEGDEKEGLAFDQDSYNEWKKYIAEDRILRGNKKDNFWEMGDTGPCGPCSEIHIDLRSNVERKKIDGATLVNNDHPQVIEIWNNVFMEFNRKADGSLEKLPAQHVDTGMGFERLVRAIEGKSSNYDTDVFVPTIKFIEQYSGIVYQFSSSDDESISHLERRRDIAMRVMADHIRAISFAIADGQLPSNTGAGYVIRRILRRAVRYQYQFLNIKEPFLCKLAEIISENFKNVFPELHAQKDFVVKVIREEEISFLRTLGKGISQLDFIMTMSHSSSNSLNNSINGYTAFELYDTYGFPIDLTRLIATENGFEVDNIGFEEELQKQKARSRKATEITTDDWIYPTSSVETLHATSLQNATYLQNLSGLQNATSLQQETSKNENTKFLGYDILEAEIKIIKYRKVKAKGKDQFQLVFNQTPFYPEGGGQVGDAGFLYASDGSKPSDASAIRILDTKKENNLIIHFADKLPAQLTDDLKPSDSFIAKVDIQKRKLTENNHSATHLLHAALRSVLGNHVQQKGSLVNEENLRFDFSHFAAMTDDEIAKVEHIVNAKIRENISLDERRNVPIDEAKTLGAMMLFGEKYGESVRVITFDEKYSRELCGGTHVKATGQIGLFKITSEAAVAAGVRRIEAITADACEKWVNSYQLSINSLKNMLKSNDLVKSVEQLLEEKNELLKKLEVFENEKTVQLKNQLKAKVKSENSKNVLIELVEISSADQLKNLSFQLKNEVENLFCVLGCELNGKPFLSVIISENLVTDNKLDAGKIVKDLAKEIQGGGGGQPFYATAGGN
ncbi:MAG: alanine--tRNA ligase, partial [Bacteroidota bacterium]